MKAWETVSSHDLALATLEQHRCRVEESELKLVRWCRGRKGYVGVSWGKDSVCIARMAAQLIPHWPLVWVRHQLHSPECEQVRDVFLVQHPDAAYEEVVIDLIPNDIGGYHLTGTLERGFAIAAKKYGRCHVSGVRGQESGIRERLRRYTAGENKYALAPIIEWSGNDIWAYLAQHNLPIHPAYAMNFAGTLNRDNLRVCALTKRKGIGKGNWEKIYYPEYTEHA